MFQLPSRSDAYSRPRPLGWKVTDRSCSGVLVMRRVSPYLTEVTKISPRATKAISLPSGERSKSVMARSTSVRTTSLKRSSAAMVMSRRRLVGGAGRPHIDRAVIAVAEVPRVGDAEKTHRVGVVVGDLDRLCTLGEGESPDVERAVALRQIVDRVFAGRPHRLAVVGAELGEPGVLFAGRIVDPDIACKGRVVVFAPVGFERLVVGVDHARPGRVEQSVDRGRGENLFWHAAGERHRVELGLGAASGVADHRLCVEPPGGEQHALSVGGEARREVIG